YILAVEAPGFARDARPVRLDHSGVTTLDISLKVAGINTEVVVTAEGKPQTIDEVSKAVSVVNADQIERRDEHSLIEALRPVPGVRVEQMGGPGSFSKILIRGL